MASKKKKGKKSRSRKRRPPASRHGKLISKMEKQGLLEDTVLIHEPRGKEKMSEVLEEFAQPYLDLVDDSYEMQNKVMATAVLAWNFTLLPRKARKAAVEDLVSSLSLQDEKMEEDTRRILKDMIERKKRYFRANKRFIISYELSMTKNGFYLSVASTL
jgi:hypothetical protein